MRWRDSQGGFTLTEMVVIIGIFAVLVGLIVASTQIGNRRQELRDASEGYISAARQAESLASSAQAVGPSGSEAARKAYGVCITSSQIANSQCTVPTGAQTLDTYQVYARSVTETAPDVLDSLTNAPGAAVSGVTSPPYIVATYRLPKDLLFSTSNIWLDYIPPAPTMYANGSTAEQTVSIRHKDVIINDCASSQDCREIQVRPRAGAVYVE